MIFKHIRRILLWLASSLITLIGLSLLGLNLLPLATPYLQQHRQFVETLAKNILEQPVAIETVRIAHKGIMPVVQLQNVVVLNDAASDALIKVKDLKIEVDPLRSLWRMSIQPKALMISEAHIYLFQNPDGHITLAKPEDAQSCISDQNKKYITLFDILEFAFTQEKIYLEDVYIDWFTGKNNGVTAKLSRLNLQPCGRFKQVAPPMKQSNLSQTSPKTLNFHLKIAPNGLQFKSFFNKDGLSKWLNRAFANEHNISGSINIYGLEANEQTHCQNEKTFIVMHLKGLNLNYFPNWPALKNLQGDLVVKDGALTINANSGMIEDIPFINAKAEISNLAEPILSIDSKFVTSMQKGLNFIKASPLNNSIGAYFKNLDLRGALDLALKLKFKLGGEKHQPIVDGKINLHDNALAIPVWSIVIKNLRGELNFTARELSAKNIVGHLFDKAVHFDLKTLNPNTQQSVLEASVYGKGESKILVSRLVPNLTKYIQGVMDYNATLKIFNKNNLADNILLLTSDLLGTTVALPPPLEKKAQEKKAMQVLLKFKNDRKKQLTLTYGNELLAMWSGKSLIAKIDRLIWSDWQPYFSAYLSAIEKNSKQGKNSNLEKIVLDFSQFNIFGQDLKTTKINMHLMQKAKTVKAAVKSSDISGDITLHYAKPHQFIRGQFVNLYLKSNKTEPRQIKVNPKDVYPLNITSTNFKFDDMNLGTLELKTLPCLEGLKINALNINTNFFSLNAEGQWKETHGDQQTNLHGELRTNNLGALLKFWKLGQNLVDGRGKTTFNLSWSQPFFTPDLKTLNGEVNLNFNDGRIINLGSKAEEELGIGRFLNLFSLQSIPRHLTLDFRDITSKGFGFDKIRGTWQFKNGDIFTHDTSLEGEIAYIKVMGRIGLIAKDYDLKLFTTPHITGNLPVVAAVVTQPIVGAAVWVFDQFIKHKAKNVRRPTYSITGSWTNPTIVKIGKIK